MTLDFSSAISELNKQIDTINEQINVLTARRSSIEEAIDALRKIETPRARELYHLDSRTNYLSKSGHFIERYADGTFKCSCEAGRYGGRCWAVDAIEKNIKSGDNKSFSYPLANAEFDKRARPVGPQRRLPFPHALRNYR